MTIFVVMPVHNRSDGTLACIGSLRDQRAGDWRLIVVDDGSTDGTGAILRERAPEVEIIRTDGSLWWGGAAALGIEHALASAADGDFILLLNNDVLFGPEYLAALVATSAAHGRALTGSFAVDAVDPERIVDSGVQWDWRAAQRRPAPVGGAVNCLAGRGLLVPIEVLHRVGNLDARRLPHYKCDYEFACRADRAGIPLVVSDDAVLRVHANPNRLEGHLDTPRSPRELWTLLTSRRSIRNPWYALVFVRLACPRRYRLRNMVAVMASTTLLVTNVPPVFQVKHGCFRLLPRRAARVWLVERRMMPGRA